MTCVSGVPKDLSVSFGSVTVKAWPPAFPGLRYSSDDFRLLPVDLSSHMQLISSSLEPCDVGWSPVTDSPQSASQED